ncbi:hypothetical protein VTK73DRAFT_451 [Phialemonium thermophilum]|uniref:DUF7357 domain-containing protein n=1 Tax=Phialemonium thermophilum TaxID=223376 RepID=A0ABR3VV56_9PEZI
MTRHESLRLRLVVRRHGLPEVRVVFPVSLDHEPTVAKLLEQVNETVPLESTDWGLEDYVVELRDREGTAFECLHFQPLRSVLLPDEEVFIRPLFTEDRKKRLLSGRDQISRDGRHLIDGLPFGRPRLKPPKGRPPVSIPPLKRRRLTYPDDDEEEDLDEDEDDDEDYQPMLLTEHGEADEQDPSSVKVAADFADADDEGEEGLEDGDAADEDSEQDGGDDEDGEEEEEQEEEGDEDKDDEYADIDETELADLEEEVRALHGDRDETADGGEGGQGKERTGGASVLDSERRLARLSALDKITALRAAFPLVDPLTCGKVLEQCGKSETRAYKQLGKSYRPSLSRRQMQHFLRSLSAPSSPRRPNGRRPSEHEQEQAHEDSEEHDSEQADGSGGDSGAESVSSLVKHYDSHGFPDGSILAGTASTHMAESLRRAGELVKLPVHIKFDDKAEAAAARQQQTHDGTRTSESGGESAADGEEDAESESPASPSDSDSEEESNSASDDVSSSGDSSSSSSSEEEDDDSGPEEAPARPSRQQLSESDSDGGSSDDESQPAGGSRDDNDDDGGTQNQVNGTHLSNGVVQRHVDARPAASARSESSSSVSSSDSGSRSVSTSDSDTSREEEDHRRKTDGKDMSIRGQSTQAPQAQAEKPPSSLGRPHDAHTQKSSDVTDAATARRASPSLVAPGSGLRKTKARNARRRAALKAAKARKLQQEEEGSASQQTIVSQPSSRAESNATAALEALKSALLQKLDQVADGGELLDRTDHADHGMVGGGGGGDGGGPSSPRRQGTVQDDDGSTDTVAGAPDPSRRKSKLDVSAGRRVLFGALGLRTPKTKADEDEIRERLMKDVRPLVNARLVESTSRSVVDDDDDDDEAWREKINYRAVECCHPGVELSEPPFPFVQRWDPQQQQSAWRTSGSGKKRGATEYHDEDEYGGGGRESAKKKQKHEEQSRDASHRHSAADHYDGEDGKGQVVLNYDDDVREEAWAGSDPLTEHSQLTDLDDLPSLPKDLSALPPLRPGEAKVGMVVTWKQWILSRATNWQPSILDLTGLVVHVNDNDNAGDAQQLRIILAKRDRHVDRNEKTYDEEGNRVYDRFEAPDLDDDGGVADDEGAAAEDGYRTLAFSDMIEPRILQQPLPSLHDDRPPAREPIAENASGEDNGPAQSQAGAEATEKTLGKGSQVDGRMSASQQDGDVVAGKEESVIPETILLPPQEAEESLSQSASLGSSAAVDVSISDDRREEISHLIAPMDGAADEQPEGEARPVQSGNSSAAMHEGPVPSPSASSPRSGRQPDPGHSFDLGREQLEDTVESGGGFSATLGSTPRQGVASDKASGSRNGAATSPNESLPLLSEALSSSQVTGSNESPSRRGATRAAAGAQQSTNVRPKEYPSRHVVEVHLKTAPAQDKTADEAKADQNGSTHSKTNRSRLQGAARSSPLSTRAPPASTESAQVPSRQPGDSSTKASRVTTARVAKQQQQQHVQPPISPPPVTRSQSRRRTSSPFSLPSGTQVVSLLSSSSGSGSEEESDGSSDDESDSSADAVERNADDDADETYRGASSPVLTDLGWVRKATQAGARPGERPSGDGDGGRRRRGRPAKRRGESPTITVGVEDGKSPRRGRATGLSQRETRASSAKAKSNAKQEEVSSPASPGLRKTPRRRASVGQKGR